MSYSQTVVDGRNEYTNLDNTQGKIKSLAIDLIWSGDSATNMIGTLNTVTDRLNQEKAKLNGFFDALNSLDGYKQNKEEIGRLKARLFLTLDIPKNAEERAGMKSQIGQLEQINASLRSKIEGILSQITPIGTATSLVPPSTNFNYITDVHALLSKYGGSLRQLKGESLSDYYQQAGGSSGLEYIEGVISTIRNTYSGREAAVNSALAMLKLAADKGVKLDYQHKGTDSDIYTLTADVVSGVDCNPWTSWVVDKGTKRGFAWRWVGAFHDVGERVTDWTQAQPGDVFVSDGHVGVIIENEPQKSNFVIAHASGTRIGIVLQNKSYSELQSGGYEIRDMTAVYEGKER